MGFEAEQKEREAAFKKYQINEKLIKYAKPDYLFMHCLPAHRGEEVSEGIIDGAHSIIIDQAENRLHAQKAIMAAIL
jgi:ornithine carbamoyltransferase